MVLCPGCHNFVGNPCACCRTASRIQFFLTRTQFPPAVEGRLVGILRQAVGEITDVAEQLGSFRTAPTPGAVAGAPDGPGGTKTEEVVKEEKSEAPVEKEKKEKKKDKAKKGIKRQEARREEARSGIGSKGGSCGRERRAQGGRGRRRILEERQGCPTCGGKARSGTRSS